MERVVVQTDFRYQSSTGVRLCQSNMSGHHQDLTEINWLPNLNFGAAGADEVTTSRRLQPAPQSSSSSSSSHRCNPNTHQAGNGAKKPPHSYGALITMAINSSPDRQMTLAEIYRWVSTHYEFYRQCTTRSWKNSIRHNLSLSKQFVKIPRGEDDPGKGCYWTVDDRFVGTAGGGNGRPRHHSYLSDNIRRDSSSKRRRIQDHHHPTPFTLPACPAETSWVSTTSNFGAEYPAGSCHQVDYMDPVDRHHHAYHQEMDPLSVSNCSDDGLLRSIMESAGIPTVAEEAEPDMRYADIRQIQHHQQQLMMSTPPSFNHSPLDLAIDVSGAGHPPPDDFDWELLIN